MGDPLSFLPQMEVPFAGCVAATPSYPSGNLIKAVSFTFIIIVVHNSSNSFIIKMKIQINYIVLNSYRMKWWSWNENNVVRTWKFIFCLNCIFAFFAGTYTEFTADIFREKKGKIQ